jgi:hypothetical protein
MSEHSEQAAVIMWARLHETKYPCLVWLHSSLNGIVIPAPPAVRARIINHMKAEGMKRGIPDLFLPASRRGFHGFYWETKTAKGRPSIEQEQFAEYAEAAGYFMGMGAAEACIESLQWYLSIEK